MKKNILVIDDDEGILEGFEALLENEGYTVTTSADASYLLNIKDKFPDLILLDVLLSGLDGRQICKIMKNDTKTKKIPIILMSAAPYIENTIEDSHADDFIQKPFEMEDLLNRITHHIRKQTE